MKVDWNDDDAVAKYLKRMAHTLGLYENALRAEGFGTDFSYPLLHDLAQRLERSESNARNQ